MVIMGPIRVRAAVVDCPQYDGINLTPSAVARVRDVNDDIWRVTRAEWE